MLKLGCIEAQTVAENLLLLESTYFKPGIMSNFINTLRVSIIFNMIILMTKWPEVTNLVNFRTKILIWCSLIERNQRVSFKFWLFFEEPRRNSAVSRFSHLRTVNTVIYKCVVNKKVTKQMEHQYYVISSFIFFYTKWSSNQYVKI